MPPSDPEGQSRSTPEPALGAPGRRSTPSASNAEPPLLASDALREDLAPVEPLQRGARIWCAVMGVVLAGLGALPLVGIPGVGPPAILPSLAVSAVAIVASLAVVTYRQRAIAMITLCTVVTVLGLAGTGPAAGMVTDGPVWGAARWIAASLVPAALLFRARYRAFSGARAVLGVAMASALPAVGRAVFMLVADEAFGLADVGAILVVLAWSSALFGFMGAETSGGGMYTGPTLVAAIALDVGLSALARTAPAAFSEMFGWAAPPPIDEDAPLVTTWIPTEQAAWTSATTTVAFALSAGVCAIGLFQVLAWRFAPAARQIDVHKPATPPEDRPSSEEWSTRN